MHCIEACSQRLVALGLVAATPGLAQTEQNFPSKPIRLVVPFSAGSRR